MKLMLDAPFDLDTMLCCGQVFRWDKRQDWWYGVVGDYAFKIRQRRSELEFENADTNFVKHYFGLEDDLQKIREDIDKDEHINRALQQFWGLRIIRQNPWECLISFICATYKNITAIKHMLLNLSEKFGEKTIFDGFTFYTFPTAEKLANADEKEIRSCSLGYRAKYVQETAKKINEGEFDLEGLRNTTYMQAKKALFGLPGVGLKVADCVLLFSLEKLEAFPVDVWVRRIILKYYTNHFPETFVQKMLRCESLSNSEYERLNSFGKEYFGKYAGYAQEYLYHYERTVASTENV